MSFEILSILSIPHASNDLYLYEGNVITPLKDCFWSDDLKEEGTETLFFESILFMIVDKNNAITKSFLGLYGIIWEISPFFNRKNKKS